MIINKRPILINAPQSIKPAVRNKNSINNIAKEISITPERGKMPVYFGFNPKVKKNKYNITNISKSDPTYIKIKEILKQRDRSKIGELKSYLNNPNPKIGELACMCLSGICYHQDLPQIKQLLEEPDDNLKIAGITIMRSVADSSDFESLIPLLKTENLKVKKEVISAIGQRGEAHHLEELIDYLHNPDTKIAVIEALGESGNNIYLQYLLPLLDKEKGETKVAVIDALAEIGNHEIEQKLVAQLKSGDKSVKAAAIRALGKLSEDKYIHRMLPVLKTSDAESKKEVMLIIANSHNEKYLDNIKTYLKDPDISHFAINAMGRCGNINNISDILPFLKDSCSKEQKLEAIKTIGRIGTFHCIPNLLDFLQDSKPENHQLKLAAINSIGQIGLEHNTNVLKPFLKNVKKVDEKIALINAIVRMSKYNEIITEGPEYISKQEPSVKKAIIKLMFNSKLQKYINIAKNYIDDPNGFIKEEVLNGIEKHGSSKDMSFVKPLLSHPWLKAYAIQIIGGWKNEENVKDLLPLLKDDNLYVQASVIKAICKLRDPKYIDLVHPYIYNKNSIVACEALEGLGTLKAKDKADEILTFLEHPNQEVQSSAIKALSSIGNKDTIPEIIPFLYKGVWQSRSDAVQAIQSLGSEEDLKEIIPLINDKKIRPKVINCIKILGNENHIPIILPYLNNTDYFTSKQVIFAIGKLGKMEHIPLLLDSMKAKSSNLKRDVVHSVCEILSKYSSEEIKNSEEYKKFIELFKENKISSKVKVALVEDLQRLNLPNLLEDVDFLINDKNDIVKKTVIKLIIQNKDKKYLDQILTLLKTNNPHLLYEVINAIAAIGSPINVYDITKFCHHDDPKVKESFINAVASFGKKDQVGNIKYALTDNNRYVRTAAINALAKLGKNRDLQYVYKFFEPHRLKYSDNVKAAINAVSTLGTKDDIDVIKPLLDHPDCKEAAARCIEILQDKEG